MQTEHLTFIRTLWLQNDKAKLIFTYKKNEFILSIDETTVRTFRLRKDWDDILVAEADERSISVSSLLNQIVRRYAVAQRFFNNSDVMVMENRLLAPILEVLSMEQLRAFGKTLGTNSVREGIAMRGLPMDFESVEYMIAEIYDRYSGWFKSNSYEDGSNYVINLSHMFGEKWSMFIGGFIESMLENILNIEVTPLIYEHSVIVRVPKKLLKTL
jgi:hypothetical protein